MCGVGLQNVTYTLERLVCIYTFIQYLFQIAVIFCRLLCKHRKNMSIQGCKICIPGPLDSYALIPANRAETNVWPEKGRHDSSHPDKAPD